MEIGVLIPAFEPDDKLLALCLELRSFFRIVVVDDGSGEEYQHIFSDLAAIGVGVLRHDANRGKGAALKTGIRFFAEQNAFGGIITADADGQHTACDIARVALHMEANPDTLILGGRDFRKMPPRSRLGNTVTRFFFRLCTGLKLSDTQTGLRGLPSCLFGRLCELGGERYEYEMNALLALRAWDAAYMEIPIDTVYHENNRASHFHALRDGWRVFSRVIRYALSSLSCTAADYLLYLAFLTVLPAAGSYIAARVFSAALNYTLNCKVVFRGKPTWKNFLGYALLAVCSMLIGAASVDMFVMDFGWRKLPAKLLVDGCLFFVNYLVQRHILFRRAGGRCFNK